jgi:hypothetical protein
MERVLVLIAASFAAATIASADSTPTQVPEIHQIALDSQVMPPGGTLSSEAGGWAVHGTIDGIAYVYGTGSHFLQVANRSGQDWQELNPDNAWLVRCSVATPMDARSCWVLRVRGVDPSGKKIAGLEIKDKKLCFPSDIMIRRAEIAVDSGAPVVLQTPNFCLKDAAAAALLQTIGAGQVVHLKGFFANDTPVVDMQLQTAGLRQALTLRDWILAQYAAGKLKLAP